MHWRLLLLVVSYYCSSWLLEGGRNLTSRKNIAEAVTPLGSYSSSGVRVVMLVVLVVFSVVSLVQVIQLIQGIQGIQGIRHRQTFTS